jgi:pyridoxal phosphate-dependent aminotransferase EpsN
MSRIYISPPHLSGNELSFVEDAFESNWLAPLGPHVDAFEAEMAQFLGVGHAAALSSGTAALHLALRLVGVKPGDEVICPTLTFSATANPILYERGCPVFIDAESSSWNIDPELMRCEIKDAARRGNLPRAANIVDLYGQSADYDRIFEVCAEHDIPIIEDAAEALGATYQGRKVGGFGKLGILSFNGNKIITTSGGGMLVSDEQSLIEEARFLATQAREPAPHYEHSVVGYNYRMSNVLAAIGRAQLGILPERIRARRRIFSIYREGLGELPGLAFMPEAAYGRATRWLTCITVDQKEFGASREDVRLALAAANIEARPVWKPLHLQPIFSAYRVRGGAVAQNIFAHGLCLPSGSSLSDADLNRIIEVVRSASVHK